MPIIGLIPEQVTIRDGLPEIARLRKGIKTDDPKRPMIDLDYFRIDFNEQFKEYEPIFTELYGDKPDVFHDVELFGDTLDEVWSMDMEAYNTSSTLLHRCDREYQSRWYDEKSGYFVTAQTPCLSKWDMERGMKTHAGCTCEEKGRLAIVMRDFNDESGLFGYFLVQTGSINDLITIYSAVKFWADKCNKTFRIPLSTLTFTLGRATQEKTAPETKKVNGKQERTGRRMKIQKSLFYLHTDYESVREARLLAASNRMALPATVDEPHELHLADGLKTERVEKIKNILGTTGKIRKLEARPADDPGMEPVTADDNTVEAEIVEETEPETTYNLEAVRNAVDFLYGNAKHRDNSVAALIKDGDIKPDYSDNAAAVTVLMHRIQKDHGLDTAQVIRLINEQLTVPVKSVGEYLQKHTMPDVWGIVKAAKAAPEGEPA
jgi:hypothetical protein